MQEGGLKEEEGERKEDSPAVMTMNSQIPRLRVLVASLAPFLSCLKCEACCTRSRI